MHAKDYPARADLEHAVLAQFGPNITVNLARKDRITGTTEELAQLFLTEKTTVHGIRCAVVEPVKKKRRKK